MLLSRKTPQNYRCSRRLEVSPQIPGIPQPDSFQSQFFCLFSSLTSPHKTKVSQMPFSTVPAAVSGTATDSSGLWCWIYLFEVQRGVFAAGSPAGHTLPAPSSWLRILRAAKPLGPPGFLPGTCPIPVHVPAGAGASIFPHPLVHPTPPGWQREIS